MPSLFGSVQPPKYPDPWEISEAGNRTMASVFSQAFNTAYQAKAQERRMQMEREDPITALKMDHVVNQLAADAIDLRAAQLKERITTDQINEKARGLTFIQEALDKHGNNVEAFSTLTPNGNKTFDDWLQQVQTQGAKLAVKNKVSALFNNVARYATEDEAVILSGIDPETPEGRAELIQLNGQINTRRNAEALAKEQRAQADRLELAEARKRNAAAIPEIGKLLQFRDTLQDAEQIAIVDQEIDNRLNRDRNRVQAQIERLSAQSEGQQKRALIESALRRRDSAVRDAAKSVIGSERARLQKIADDAQVELEKLLNQPDQQTSTPVSASPAQAAPQQPAAGWRPFGGTNLQFRVVEA